MKEATPTFVEVSAESIRDLNDSELRSLWLSFVDAGNAGAPYPEGLEKQEFDSRMEIVRQAMKSRKLQEQAPPAKTQTFILSKERFDTIEKARQWMTENDQPIDKVDETETSFRFRQFDLDKCIAGSFRVIKISDGVHAVICREEEGEGSSEHNNQESGHAPTSELGFDVAQSFEKINELGRKWTPEEAGFQQKSPSADVTCGACRFYLRHPTEAIGACQVVDGPIPWNATSKAYISAADEAEFAFGQSSVQESIDLPELIQEAYDGGKGPKFKILKKNRKPLTTSERESVMRQKAVWHHGPNGEPSAAVWKAVVEGVTWYVTNTHRAYNLTNSLQGTIKRYHDFIKGTAR